MSITVRSRTCICSLDYTPRQRSLPKRSLKRQESPASIHLFALAEIRSKSLACSILFYLSFSISDPNIANLGGLNGAFTTVDNIAVSVVIFDMPHAGLIPGLYYLRSSPPPCLFTFSGCML